jgi:putative ABC transport system ATP-binding protein
MNQIISVENVSKIYKTKHYTVNALSDINLNVERGEICVLIGRSGSGKTTLLNVIGGLLQPDSGKVSIDGESLYGDKSNIFDQIRHSERKRATIRNRKIGYVYQNISLVQELNALENIRLPFDIAGKKYDTEYENKIIQLLGLEERLKFYPSMMSGGEKQRVAIARAMIKKPAIILADEPNGNIDSETSHGLMEYVRKTNQEFGQTYLIVTHDKAWLEYANKVYEMHDGKLEGL